MEPARSSEGGDGAISPAVLKKLQDREPSDGGGGGGGGGGVVGMRSKGDPAGNVRSKSSAKAGGGRAAIGASGSGARRLRGDRRSTRGSNSPNGSAGGDDEGSGSGGDDCDSSDGHGEGSGDAGDESGGLIGYGSEDDGPDDSSDPGSLNNDTASTSSSSSSSSPNTNRPPPGSTALSAADADAASICLTPSPRAVSAARAGISPTQKLRNFGITTATVRDILCHTNAAPTAAPPEKRLLLTPPPPPPAPPQQRDRLVVALRVVRQALSDEKAAADGIIDDVVATGILPRIVELMSPFTNASKAVKNSAVAKVASEFLSKGVKMDGSEILHIADPLVVFEAAWILTNIGSGRSEHVMALIDEGVPAALVLVLQAECPNFASNSSSGGGSSKNPVVTLSRRTDTVDDVHAQVMWAVGNISGDGAVGRDAMLAVGGMPAVLALVDNHASKALPASIAASFAGETDVKRNSGGAGGATASGSAGALAPKFNDSFSVLGLAPWTISNLCRSTPRPPLSATERAIPVLGKLLCVPRQSSESTQDALWALYYIVSGGSSGEGADEDRRRIQLVLLDNGMPFDFAAWMVKLVSRFALPASSSNSAKNSSNPLDASVCSVAVQLLGSIVASDKDMHTQVLVDAGLLKPLRAILECSEAYFQKNIHHHVLWLLSNVTAGTEEQADAVAAADIFPVTIRLLESEATSDQVKKEAVYVLCNAFKVPVSANVVRLLVRLNCPRTFSGVILNGPEGAKPVAVQGIECLLTRLWMMVEEAWMACSSSSGDDDTGVSIPPTATSNGSKPLSPAKQTHRAVADYQARVKESRAVIATLRKLGCLTELARIEKAGTANDNAEMEECRSRARKILTAVDEFAENLERKVAGVPAASSASKEDDDLNDEYDGSGGGGADDKDDTMNEELDKGGSVHDDVAGAPADGTSIDTNSPIEKKGKKGAKAKHKKGKKRAGR